MSAVWVIKAGEKGKDQDVVLHENCAVIGWGWLGDLTEERDRERIKKTLEKRGDSPASARQKAGSIWRFVKDVKVDDLVILPLRNELGILSGYSVIGKVAGGYDYISSADNGVQHRRAVKWLEEVLTSSIPYPLGAQHTVFQVGSGDSSAHSQIASLMEGKGFVPPERTDSVQEEDGHQASGDAAAINEASTRERIKTVFAKHKLSYLIEAILSAKGYTCVVSPDGPDGGVDIVASKGDLGFDAPVCVQVKNTNYKASEGDMAKFKRDMDKHHADKGIFVSWGGFGGFKDEKILKRKFFPGMRLWNADDIMRLVAAHYESFSDEFKRTLPLRQVLLWDDSAEATE